MQQLADPELGTLYIRPHSAAVRYSFRPAKDGGAGIIVTVPRHYLLTDVLRAVEELRPKLRLMLQHQQALAQQRQQQPQPTAEQLRQQRLRREQLRQQAQQELPPRLLALAQQYGFRVDTVRISSARSRWGSCSCRRRGLFSRCHYTISLSFYCVLLPEHLQRHIMLHELTHIHHMDHSPAFHAELDAMLEGKEKEYEKELRQFNLQYFKDLV